MSGDAFFKTAVAELEKLISANSTFGEPVEIGAHAVIPVVSLGFGFGGGEARGTGGEGAGTGAGAGITPVALVVVHREMTGPESVQVLSLKRGSPLAEVIGSLGETVVPVIADALKGYRAGTTEEDEETAG